MEERGSGSKWLWRLSPYRRLDPPAFVLPFIFLSLPGISTPSEAEGSHSKLNPARNNTPATRVPKFEHIVLQNGASMPRICSR
jgi:hypothetical protein